MEELTENEAAMQLTAKTFSGLENLLAEELTGIGATEVEIINRGVKFVVTLKSCIKQIICAELLLEFYSQ